VSADRKGTPEVHGKMGLNKHMPFQWIRLVGAVGIESTSDMETKEFCGATWPSKELKRKERNS